MKTTTNSKPFRLFVPDLWRPTIDKFAHLHAGFRNEVEIFPLDVNETGINDPIYSELKNRPQNELTVFMLPVSHCALNIDQYNLQIIGPAIATRDDIFVFRRNERPRYKASRGRFFVAVREIDITTSNVLRIVAANSTCDLFMHADFRESPPHGMVRDSIRAIMKNGLFSCRLEAKSSADRLQLLLTGRCDAAIFTGDELIIRDPNTDEELSLFDHEKVIDAFNLNREINNFYHVRALPRAVLCTSNVDDKRIGLADNFSALYSNAATAFREQTKPTPGERSRQIPSLTGKLSEKINVSTLLRFTVDMHSDEVKALRSGDIDVEKMPTIEESRELKYNDFLYWNTIYRSDLHSSIVESMNAHNTERDSKFAGIDNFETLVEKSLKGLAELPNDVTTFTKWARRAAGGQKAYELGTAAPSIWKRALSHFDARLAEVEMAR